MKRIVCILILSALASTLSAAPVSIIPQPAEVVVKDGCFHLNASTVYVVDFDDPKVEYALEFFNGVAKDLFGTGLVCHNTFFYISSILNNKIKFVDR